MKRGSLYLDTSVPSAYYDARVKARMEATRKFWREVLPSYHPQVSEITVQELEDTRDENLRRRFRELLKSFKILKTNESIRRLANVYILKGIFPERYFEDALHVAIASYFEIPYLLSWNYEHLVKVKTRRLVNLANALEGFREIEIISPLEL